MSFVPEFLPSGVVFFFFALLLVASSNSVFLRLGIDGVLARCPVSFCSLLLLCSPRHPLPSRSFSLVAHPVNGFESPKSSLHPFTASWKIWEHVRRAWQLNTSNRINSRSIDGKSRFDKSSHRALAARRSSMMLESGKSS